MRADQRAEEILQETLFEARPNYGFVGTGGRETKGKILHVAGLSAH